MLRSSSAALTQAEDFADHNAAAAEGGRVQSHLDGENTRAALIKNMEQLRNKSISRSPDGRRPESTNSGFATEQPATRLRQSNAWDRVDYAAGGGRGSAAGAPYQASEFHT